MTNLKPVQVEDYAPLIKPKPAIGPNQYSSLVISFMAVPFPSNQIIMPELRQYTQSEIVELWKDALEYPKKVQFSPNECKLNIPFDLEEEYALLNFIKTENNNTSSPNKLQNYLQEFGYLIKPFRSKKSILEEINRLKSLPEKDRVFIIEKMTMQLLNEQVYSNSINKEIDSDDKNHFLESNTFKAAHCNLNLNPLPECTPDADKEIDSLNKCLDILSENIFGQNDLAILRSETKEYYMRRAAVLIGRGSLTQQVDIDISDEIDPMCSHISRYQAILSFLEDYKFYIQNIGNRQFRVNGVLIPSGYMCRLDAGSIIDLSGVLLMFIPNNNLVAQIIDG